MDRQLIAQIRDLDDYETQTARLARKLRETPFLGIGLVGLVGACTIGAMRYNKRTLCMPASFYLMQLRVAAQGSVVGSMAVGLIYSMYQAHN